MQIKLVKPSSASEKQTRTTMDTIELNPKLVASWKQPPFQRDLKINAKVMAVAKTIEADGGVLPGVITLGVLDGVVYVVDGQHRIAAWAQTGLTVGYADVRTHWFDSLGEMAQEFVNLNSQLVRMKPDDILRGLEPGTIALQQIRRKCGFVGYDMVRRGDKSPVLSMSTFIRTWAASASDVPSPGSYATLTALAAMTDDETTHGIAFLGLAFEAWQRDRAYGKLWGSLNLLVCAWLYRRVVLGEKLNNYARSTKFKPDEFRQCLMALSAEPHYLDYLVGRNTGERDRGPTYGRVKQIFQRRYHAETGKKLVLPQPAWSSHQSGRAPAA